MRKLLEKGIKPAVEAHITIQYTQEYREKKKPKKKSINNRNNNNDDKNTKEANMKTSKKSNGNKTP